MPELSRSPSASLADDLKAQDGRSPSGSGKLSTAFQEHALAFMQLMQNESADATKRTLTKSDSKGHENCDSELVPELSNLPNAHLELEAIKSENVRLRAEQTNFARLRSDLEKVKKAQALISEEYKRRMEQADSDALTATEEIRRLREQTRQLTVELTIKSEEKEAMTKVAKEETCGPKEEKLFLTDSLGTTRTERDLTEEAAEDRPKLQQEVQSQVDSLLDRTQDRDLATKASRNSNAQLLDEVLSLTNSLRAAREESAEAAQAASENRAYLEEQVRALTEALDITTKDKDRAAKEARESIGRLRDGVQVLTRTLRNTIAEKDAAAEAATKENAGLREQVRALDESLRATAQERVSATEQLYIAGSSLRFERSRFVQQTRTLARAAEAFRVRTRERDAAANATKTAGHFMQVITKEMRQIREGLQRTFNLPAALSGTSNAPVCGPDSSTVEPVLPSTLAALCQSARREAVHLREVYSAVNGECLSLLARKASLELAEMSHSEEIFALRAEVATLRKLTDYYPATSPASFERSTNEIVAPVTPAGVSSSHDASQDAQRLSGSLSQSPEQTTQYLDSQKVDSQQSAEGPQSGTKGENRTDWSDSQVASPDTSSLPMSTLFPGESAAATDYARNSSVPTISLETGVETFVEATPASYTNHAASSSFSVFAQLDESDFVQHAAWQAPSRASTSKSPTPLEASTSSILQPPSSVPAQTCDASAESHARSSSLQSSATVEDRLEQAVDLIQRFRYYSTFKCEDEESQRAMDDVQLRLRRLTDGWPEEHQAWISETNRRDKELAVSLLQSCKRLHGCKDEEGRAEWRRSQERMLLLIKVRPNEVQNWVAEVERRDADRLLSSTPMARVVPPSTAFSTQKRRSPSPSMSELIDQSRKKARMDIIDLTEPDTSEFSSERHSLSKVIATSQHI